MTLSFALLLAGALAAWRLTHLLVAEDGPFDIVVRLRRAAGDGFWGAVMDCFYCASLWVAAPLALWLGHGLGGRILLWLAFSGGAILLERATAFHQTENTQSNNQEGSQ
jgi:hypothetical protein